LTFKEQYDLFQSLTPPVEVIGISQDSVEDHRRFKEDLNLPFPLLSDPERLVADAFGVPVFLGRFPAKSSFLIGPDRTVHYCYDWLFRPRRHVARILDTFSELSSGGSMK
jgi:peroxiredoxin Q/BCP